MLTDYLTYHPHKVKRNKNHSVDIMNALRAQNLSAETLIDKLALSNKEEDKKLLFLSNTFDFSAPYKKRKRATLVTLLH